MSTAVWFVRILAILAILAILSVFTSGTAKAGSPAGRWKGSWSSGSSGHRGALRARIQPSDHGSYEAIFAGRFAVIIPFIYRTELTPIAGAPGQYYSSKKLPLVGTYNMRATISGSQFYATFTGKRDQGIFRMQRR